MIFMNRGNGDDSRARKAKADADAYALLSALSNRGRLTPLPAGTIVQNKYRIERHLRSSEQRNQYLVSWDDQAEGRLCWECGFEGNAPSDLKCSECQSDLGGRQFVLSERWRVNFQPYLEVQEEGLFHPGLARIYEVFEDTQRLFSVLDYPEGGVLSEMGSPLPIDDLLEIALRGSETLHYLHSHGIVLGGLAKDQVLYAQGTMLFHDLDLVEIIPTEVLETDRRHDLERFGRLLREFVPYDAPELRALFDEACEGRFDRPLEFSARLKEIARSSRRSTEVHVAAMSDVGMIRTLNEDNWGWEKLTDDISLYVVADGMGGHDGGEIASEMAVKTLLAGVRRRLKDKTDLEEEALENLLDEAFQEANNTIKGFSEKRRSDMGTTLVTVMFHKNRTAFIANVGDSRAYLYRTGDLKQVSQDHSLVANLVAMGKITKAAARNHPHSNILVRTVGKEWDVEIDIFRQDIRPGDAFLLCSDGLWGEVEDTELVDLMRDFPDPRVACQELIRAANGHGGHDNVTALLVRVV